MNVSHTVFPETNSIMPEMNWHTPPKNIRTPTRTFGVAIPRACTPYMDIKKIPVPSVGQLTLKAGTF
jgi:hypothetical protein